MLTMEEVISEWNGEEVNEQGLPPGFRFHPTDEELISCYLASKVFNGSFSGVGVDIVAVDLNRCEPWDLPETAKMGEREWYFFSLRDRKYPTGLRTNRTTGAGYWKATGKDREVYSACKTALLGMKKTLVFYKGRAPRGIKTRWVMHEYRLDGHLSYRNSCKEEWVMCRVFHKRGEKKGSIFQGLVQQNFVQEASSPTHNSPLPPLHETPTPPDSQLQNPFLVQQHESDLKSLLNIFNNPPSQPNLIPSSALQASFPPTSTTAATAINPTSATTAINKSLNTNHHLAPSIAFKSLLSHQDSYCAKRKEQHQPQPSATIPKQYKPEAYFSSIFQLLHDPNNDNPNNNNNNAIINSLSLHSHWLHKISQIPPSSPPLPAHLLSSQSQCPLNFGSDCGAFGFTANMSASMATADKAVGGCQMGLLLAADAQTNIAGEAWALDSAV